jgi:hypothetical protein
MSQSSARRYVVRPDGSFSLLVYGESRDRIRASLRWRCLCIGPEIIAHGGS